MHTFTDLHAHAKNHLKTRKLKSKNENNNTYMLTVTQCSYTYRKLLNIIITIHKSNYATRMSNVSIIKS